MLSSSSGRFNLIQINAEGTVGMGEYAYYSYTERCEGLWSKISAKTEREYE